MFYEPHDACCKYDIKYAQSLSNYLALAELHSMPNLPHELSMQSYSSIATFNEMFCMRSNIFLLQLCYYYHLHPLIRQTP